MAGKWKPGDLVRVKGTVTPQMNVAGPNAKDPNKVDCDWLDNKNKPQKATYHEDQLEAIGDDDVDFLPITRG